MSADGTPLEEQIDAMLAACDDALAEGKSPPPLADGQAPAELRPRLDQAIGHMRLLRRVLGRPLTRLGPFEIRRELGQGTFGLVFLAHDPRLCREVALKVPRPEALVTGELRERFLREARAAAALDHPNVVAIYEAGEIGSICYIASAYCPGITLAQWLKERSEPVAPNQAAGLIATLAAAIEHAHRRGVVHRDLKPGNVLLEVSAGAADGFIPKVSDFGLAKFGLAGETQTRTGSVLGTPAYMAPEQAEGKKGVGPAADIYALGAILYELLTGRPPFLGEGVLDTLEQVRSQEPVPPGRLRPRLPRDLETICLRCLYKEPGKRYASAQALAEDLERFLQGRPVLARRTSAVERAWRWCRRNPVLAATVTVALAALVAAAVVSIGFALYHARAAQRLEKEQRATDAALQESRQQRDRSERHAASLAAERGQAICEQGDVGLGMLWLERALTMTPAEDVDLRHAIRVGLAGWGLQLHPVEMRLPHPQSVKYLALSRDEKFVATDCNDHAARVWDTASGRLVGGPFRHPGRIFQVDLSPDGRILITGCTDAVRLFDVAAGKLIGDPLPHANSAYSVAFAPDGKTFLTMMAGNKAQRWETHSRRPLGKPFEKPGAFGVRYSGQGVPLLIGHAFGVAEVWNLFTEERVGVPLKHDEPLDGAVLCADDRTVLTRGNERTVRAWDLMSGKLLGTGALSQPDAAGGFDMTPDRSALLVGSDSGAVRVFDMATGTLRGAPLSHPSAVMKLALSADGHALWTTCVDGVVRRWTLTVPRSPLVLSHPDQVGGLAFSPDDRTLATGCKDGQVRLWEADSGMLRGTLRHPDHADVHGFSPDGRELLTSCKDKQVRLWELATGRSSGRLQMAPELLWAAASTPHGWLVLGHGDGGARLWRVDSGEPIGGALPHPGKLASASFSPDGRLVLTLGADDTARLWESATAKPAGQLRHPDTVSNGEFSPDGRLLLTGCYDGTARLWELPAARERSPDASGDSVTRLLSTTPHPALQWVNFSSNGRAFSTSSSGMARVWDTHTRRPKGPSLVQRGRLGDIRLSPDGRSVLMGHSNLTAQLIDAATGLALGPPMNHPDGNFLTTTFSPGGRLAASAGKDKTARIWQLPQPLADEPERITLWVQSATGMELDESGLPRELDEQSWQERRRRLGDLGGPPLP